MPHTTSLPFLGRHQDIAWVRGLCASAVSGRSAVAVLEGGVGIGKTRLITQALSELHGFDLVAIAGIEAEFELPFAALQRLVLARRPVLDELSESHRTSLLVAAGLADGVIADRLAIGIALLALVTTLTAKQPVFLWIDDVQWVDEESLSAFAFVARRLLADPVVMIYCRRPDTDESVYLTGLPVRRLHGLDIEPAVTLLRSVVDTKVERVVAEQIAVATEGNPLALRELTSELNQRQLDGAALLPEPVPLGARLQAYYLRQVKLLPDRCQHWLLIAAAESDGNLRTITAAAESAGLPRDSSGAAEIAELIVVTDRVVFRHPLIRSAVYAGATFDQRRETHSRLSRASAELGLDHRALLHRAMATDGIDDELADRLTTAAAVSGQRGDFATRTRLLLRAAAASTAAGRATRQLAAIQSAIFSGAFRQAHALAEDIDEQFLGPDQRAELALLRNEIRLPTFEPGALGVRAAAFLRLAVALEDAHRHEEAVGAIGMGIRSTWLSTHLTVDATAVELAEVALRLVSGDVPDATVLALRCYAEFILDHPTALATYRTATRFLIENPSTDLRYLHSNSGAVLHIAGSLIDDASRDAVLAGIEEYARRDSDNFLLANIVSFRCLFDLEVGRVASARARLAETTVLLGASGYPEDHFSLIALRAGLRGWTGTPVIDSKEAAAAIDACRSATFGAGVDLWQRAELLGCLAVGDFSNAFEAARQMLDADDEPPACVLADLVEAAVHARELRTAAQLRDQLLHRSRLLGTTLGVGLRALAEAALAGDPEPHYETAIHQLTLADAPMYTGRAHLQFGEWLRRRRRRTEATTHLEQAAQIFGAQGAEAWAARAARELTPLGVATVAQHRHAVPLTPQEEAIANLAGRGATNQEIADHLFLSASTVDYHLRKVFRKLDLTSRRQLAAALHH